MRYDDRRTLRPRTFAGLIVVGTLALGGCSSDDDDDIIAVDDEPSDPADIDSVDADVGAVDAGTESDGPGPLGSPNAAFEIDPADVDAYVADYEDAASRVRLELDGQDRSPLTLLALDNENDTAVFTVPGGALMMGLELFGRGPLPTLTLFEGDFEGASSEQEFLAAVTRSLVGTNLDLQETPEGDFVYTGRLVDEETAEESDVRFVFNVSAVTGGSTSIEIEGSDAVLSGTLGTGTYVQLRDLVGTEPDVERLVLDQVPGSANDAINLHNGYLVREAGLDTFIPADGEVASGGTDLFLAGTRRTIEDGAFYGVHSWCCEDGVEGADLPRDDPSHDPFLTYMLTMLGDAGPDFYYFTLDAAPADDLYPMTREDLIEFGVVTE